MQAPDVSVCVRADQPTRGNCTLGYLFRTEPSPRGCQATVAPVSVPCAPGSNPGRSHSPREPSHGLDQPTWCPQPRVLCSTLSQISQGQCLWDNKDAASLGTGTAGGIPIRGTSDCVADVETEWRIRRLLQGSDCLSVCG